MVCMTTGFDPNLHPRSAVGRFTAKSNTAPTSELSKLSDFGFTPSFDEIPAPTADELLDAEIESYYRQGDAVPISDDAAITIARDILHHFPSTVPGGPNGQTSQLRLIASGRPIRSTNYDAVDELHDELTRLRGRRAGSGASSDRRIESLLTWSQTRRAPGSSR